jgi:hypothetical protein
LECDKMYIRVLLTAAVLHHKLPASCHYLPAFFKTQLLLFACLATQHTTQQPTATLLTALQALAEGPKAKALKDAGYAKRPK